MPTIQFSTREDFFSNNVQIESINHLCDYTIFINAIPVIFNTIDDVYISIQDLDDMLVLTNLDSGREACRVFKQFIKYLNETEETKERIYVSSTKILFG